MKLEMTGQLRLEQKMTLAPHMIQSMEILQLPILALQERIEQELNSNPVLEVDEPLDAEAAESIGQQSQEETSPEQTGAATEASSEENFERIESLDDNYKDYMQQGDSFRTRVRSGETDNKLEALKNTAAGPKSLHEYLSDQWRLVEASAAIKKAGQMIIDFIDDRGYLSVRVEQLHNKDRADFSFEDLKEALVCVQKLDPLGIGARDLRECLLIQMAESNADMSFEIQLVAEHMDDLLENRLPGIARAMNCSIEVVNRAIERMSKLDTSPGLQIGQERNHPITADVIVEPLDDAGNNYTVRLADSNVPSLRVSDYYATMWKDSNTPEKTRKYLQNNIRSAQWIMDAIEQRKNTLLRVTKAVVKYQKEFFEKGQLYLKPLPMSKVADDVGVHLATVSRAAAGKYVQCPQGVLPLRKFFSGGMQDDNGHALSWEAIRGKLQEIIDAEDKSKPLSDDRICRELAKAGIKNLARRTVAKYRKLLNIPAARLRKKY